MSSNYFIVPPSEPSLLINTNSESVVIHGSNGSTVIHAPATVANLTQTFTGSSEDGTATGDFLRWNAETGSWEVKSEPLELTQIILTPAETAALNQEGSLFYCSTDKAVHVCTSDE